MKKIYKLLFVLLIFVFSINVYAQSDEYTAEHGYKSKDTEIRKTLDNYGVGKNIKVTDDNLDNILKTPYVNESEKIYDYAGILSDEEEKTIKELINAYIEHTGMDMVFLSDAYYSNDEMDYAYLASDFYDYNNFGFDKYYSGVVILRCTGGDGYYGIYTFGEAQLYYDTEILDYILDNMYAYYHNNKYLDGTRLAIDSLTGYFDSGKALPDYYIDENGYIHKDKTKFKIPYFLSGIIGGITSLFAVGRMKKKNKMIKKATNAVDYEDKATTKFNKKIDNFISTFTTRHRNASSSSSGGHSSFSGSSGRGFGGSGRRG